MADKANTPEGADLSCDTHEVEKEREERRTAFLNRAKHLGHRSDRVDHLAEAYAGYRADAKRLQLEIDALLKAADFVLRSLEAIPVEPSAQ
jgi:hypothetical protein